MDDCESRDFRGRSFSCSVSLFLSFSPRSRFLLEVTLGDAPADKEPFVEAGVPGVGGTAPPGEVFFVAFLSDLSATGVLGIDGCWAPVLEDAATASMELVRFFLDLLPLAGGAASRGPSAGGGDPERSFAPLESLSFSLVSFSLVFVWGDFEPAPRLAFAEVDGFRGPAGTDEVVDAVILPVLEDSDRPNAEDNLEPCSFDVVRMITEPSVSPPSELDDSDSESESESDSLE